MSDGGFPGSPPPPPPPSVTPIVSGGRPWWQAWWVVAVLAVVLVVALAAAITSATGGGGDDDDDEATPATTAATEPDTTEPDTTDPVATDPSGDSVPDPTPPPTDPVGTDVGVTTPSSDPPPDTVAPGDVAGAPAGARGGLDDPVPQGEIADLGEGWRLQVLDVIDDGSDLVAAENQFNDPPPPGSRFTLVRVALGFYGQDDPASAFVPTIDGLGLGGALLDDDCGVIPDDFPAFIDLFAGGVATGSLCFVTMPADGEDLVLQAVVGFDGPEVFLEASAGTAAAAVMPTLRGPQESAAATPGRLDPVAVGTPVELGAGWTLTVTAPGADITDVVLAENQFNDPPPDGFAFVGVEVVLAYDGPGTGSGFDVTVNAVADTNVELDENCGVIPNPADVFADIESGGSVSGTMCFPTPAEDLASILIYGQEGFDGPVTVFATS